ncbi:adaptin [Natronorubrum tibetense GA33]|uniref:Adaptin n=3 Tax=Natronorubrum tibetense TaxID=63128 RepID=L9VS29_9EURY|nr:adaptin [Natronorubrum tibetense GA33]
MFVLAFDRDWTVDVNPPPDRSAVPLDWVTFWAHDIEHEVWAIGNQQLVYEAGIPGVIEAVDRYYGDLDIIGEQDESGEYDFWPSRERRLELLAELFPDARKHIVIGDSDCSHVDGWEQYTAWEFREAVTTGSLSAFFHPPSIDSDTISDTSSDHVETIRQQLRTASEAQITVSGSEEDAFRTASWKKPRPTALPVDAPATLDFTTTAGDTRRIQLPDITDVTVLEEQPESEREHEDNSKPTADIELPDTGLMLRRVERATYLTTAQRVEFTIDVLKTATKLSALPKKLMGEFNRAIDDVPDGTSPVDKASSYAARHPSHLQNHVSDLSRLTGVTDTGASRHATWCLMELAEKTPEPVIDAVPALTTALTTDDEPTRTYATYALTCISNQYPEELLPALDTLINQLDNENQTIRTNTHSAVGHIVNGYPDTAVAHTDSIATLLESDTKRVRNNATGLLADIAQEHPDRIIEYADDLAARLTDPNIQARINASIALLRAGEANPEAVRNHHRQLEKALDDSSPEMRANACVLVTNTDAPVSIEILQELRANDPDETVRDHAAMAIRRRDNSP